NRRIGAEPAPSDDLQTLASDHRFHLRRPFDVTRRQEEHKRGESPQQRLIAGDELFFLAGMRAPGHKEFLVLGEAQDGAREKTVRRSLRHRLVELDVAGATYPMRIGSQGD